MPKQQFRAASFLAMLLGVALFSSLSVAADAAKLRIAQDNTGVSIFDGDQLVLHYRYANVSKKPYADQLASPKGVQILRDSPHDHVHHHGLMYALAADKVNFWEETTIKDPGVEKHKSLSDVKATASDGCDRAGFVEELDWIGPASDKPLLLERRTVHALKADDLGATLIEWGEHFQTPPGKDSAEITSQHYYGLGMRFLASMDKGGRFFNADDAAGELVVGGDQRLTPVKWVAYTAKLDEKPVTVAIFDHPANFRYPGKKFTMSNPFAYLAATLNAWKEPFTITKDKPLDLRYGVALWDGEVDKATVEKLYQRWLALAPAEKK